MTNKNTFCIAAVCTVVEISNLKCIWSRSCHWGRDVIAQV